MRRATGQTGLLRKARCQLRRFVGQTDGAGTATSLFAIVGTLMIGGLAVDQANGWRVNTQLQVAADASALVAAAHISDPDRARQMAVDLAAINLGGSDALTAQDITFGTWDRTTDEFIEGGVVNAVRVNASRGDQRGNAISTHFLKFVGFDFLETNVTAIAAAAQVPGGGRTAGCEDAAFISSGNIQTGGGNNLQGAICIHGQNGVATGGGGTMGPDVRFSAANSNQIQINGYESDDVPVEQLMVERSMRPTILPELNRMRSELWAALWTANPSTYSGDLLPDFVFNADGSANVVRKNESWQFKQDELQPNTIYVINGDASFPGLVDTSNVALVASGDIHVGGGYNLQFDKVFFFGRNLRMSGGVTWGPRVDPCGRDDYSVYLFGTESLSLGGWGGDNVNGVVGAAPSFVSGGAMKGSNVYFESGSSTSLGGGMDITSCDKRLKSEYAIAEMGVPEDSNVRGSYLAR